MRILAIESSALTASVALTDDDTLVAEYTINYKKTHSQTILPMIDEITKITETDCNTIDLIAVSNGPGSFTGLRIGAATGKGLALSLDKPMVAVPTLEAMAYNLMGDNRLICPVMDAKRKHLYSGMYTFEGERINEVMAQSLISYENLADKLNELGCEVVFVGDGIDVAQDYFKDNLTCRYSFAPLHIRTQRAGSVAFAAKRMFEEGKIISSDEFCPDYIRPSQAEREHECRIGGANQ
ncbi:MAG: tRNA (adenosine(37)-N6)-threonylcarbamoyltransferase complex dimerization subunit type 1 TsaB [Lachnospira sp.]